MAGGRKLTLDPAAVDENEALAGNKRGPRLCDLSAEELRKLWQKPSNDEMKASMETMARLAFQLRGQDPERQRRLLKGLKAMQELMSMDD